MCGIAGVVYTHSQRPVDGDLLRRMTDRLAHRGPDGQGAHVAPGVGLGIRRLSIIDLETGDQPLANEDGTVVVVCNGEIYNFVELRAELERRGHHFQTRSDVEVIPHLYEEHGVDFVGRLRGMFGLALWDARRRRLLLARDRLGIKPLLYSVNREGIWWASELKALLASRDVERSMDLQALHDVFTLGFVMAPRTLFGAIRQLLPGHCLVYEQGALSLHQYWSPRFPPVGDAAPRRSAGEWGRRRSRWRGPRAT